MDTALVLAKLRTNRLRLKLTQAQLASASGISVPAIQKLEAGKGNPSLSTLLDLCKVLRLSLKLESSAAVVTHTSKSSADLLSLLIKCGLPLMQKNTSANLNVILNEQLLIQTLLEFTARKKITLKARESEALSAFLLALKSHYPSIFRRCGRTSTLKKLTPVIPTGRQLKLRRIALASLSHYL